MFLELAAAVDNKGDVLTVFRRLDGGTFGRGFDVPDLRIARRLKLGYKLLLGQGMGRRENADYHQTPQDYLRDCSCRHDLSSSLCGSQKHDRRLQRLSTQRFLHPKNGSPEEWFAEQ